MDLVNILFAFLFHNPLFILAFLLWVGSAWSSCHVLLKLARAGYTNDVVSTAKVIATLPHVYLRVRQSHGWPASPAHFVWISSILGFVAFAGGIFRLFQ